MFDDIRAPRGPEFRPLGPRAACAARPAEQFIFFFSRPSAQIYWHVHKNTESKSRDKNDTDTRPYTGHLTQIQMQMHEDS